MCPPVDRRFGLIFSLSLAAHAAALFGLPGIDLSRQQAAPSSSALATDSAGATRIQVTLLAPSSLPAPRPSLHPTPAAVPGARAASALPPPVLSSPRPSRALARPHAPASMAAPSAPSAPVPPSTPVVSVPETMPSAPALALLVQGAQPAASNAAPAMPSSEAMLDAYRRQLNALVAAPRDYPRLAALRGWEGEVRLRLRIARKGNLLAVQLDRSSGFEVLDQHALALLGQYGDFPPLPERWEGSDLQVVIPIHYKLRKTT